MKNKLLAIAIAFIGLFSFVAVPTYATNANICSQTNVADEIKSASGCSGAKQPADIKEVAQNIITAVLGVLGIVAVVFIIIGGINYMTSNGDTGKTQKARNTILYAVIGLIVCGFAGIITNFVINAINTASSENSNSSNTATGP